MRIKLNKDKFDVIDSAFLVLKEHADSQSALKLIKDSIEDCFDATFDIQVVNVGENPAYKNAPLFVMSVYPEMGTVQKIVNSIMNDGDKSSSTVKSLWEKNRSWTIEIDKRILDDSVIKITNRELTALLLHEIGHIVCSNSITNRLTTILQYELSKINMKDKLLMKDRIFQQILSLPILNACIADGKGDGKAVKEEIKADTFAKKMGYTNELTSVLKKFVLSSQYPKESMDTNIQKVTAFSTDTIAQLRTRQENLLRRNIGQVKMECVSPYLREAIQMFEASIFEEDEDCTFGVGEKIEYHMERADKLSSDENLVTEFFIFGTKQLKKIDPAEIDYIDIKLNEVKSEGDKIMLITYLYSKLDMIDYYISILENPKLSAKYSIGNSLEQLKAMRKHLLNSRENILAYKIPDRMKGMLIAWPQNYEG